MSTEIFAAGCFLLSTALWCFLYFITQMEVKALREYCKHQDKIIKDFGLGSSKPPKEAQKRERFWS